MRGTLYLGLKLSWFEMLERGGLEKKFPPDPEDRARARRNGTHSPNIYSGVEAGDTEMRHRPPRSAPGSAGDRHADE